MTATQRPDGDTMASFEPQAFGKYFLVDKIATGGMAEIFKAKTFSHGGFENLVVIKRILGHLSDNDDFVEMFVDEAKVSVALQHANIVRVYDFGKVLDNYFIAMECVDGKDIRALLRRLSKQRQYLPSDFALFIVHEILRGLAYAHGKTDMRGHPFGIVHRDMSPSNVIVSYEGDVKIADFGIAKAEQNSYTTADGVLKGKFEYMSPEQARGAEIDGRSDLFAVGILFYEMLTGRRLFKGESDLETLERIKRADVKPPSQVTPRVPAEVERIVMKLLAADPDDRYPSASAAQADVRRQLERSPDEIRPELRQFLRDLFRPEIEQEITRLEAGSAVAAAWRSTADDSAWDGHTTTAGTLRVEPAAAPPRRRALGSAAFVALLFLMVGVAGASATAWTLLNRAPVEPAVAIAPPVAPTVGRLSVNVLPVARIFVDGQQVGEGTTFRLEDVKPGRYQLRLEADGRAPHEQWIDIGAGHDALVQHTFEAPAAEPDKPTTSARRTPSPSPTGSGKPRVDFRTDPPGASIVIDGRVVGVTPLSWSPEPDTGHAVELRLDGYVSAKGRLEPLGPGASMPYSRTLTKPAAAEPATLTIGIIGGGWGHVFIDGVQQDRPAPGKYQVAPGPRTVRVVNPDLQLDHTERVSAGSGQALKINVRP
jgi:serine/threonine protein kinase